MRPLHFALLAALALAGPLRAEAGETWPAPAGYEIVQSEAGLDIRFEGESAFAVTTDTGELIFAVEGPRDMTGNGVAEVSVLWRSARSASSFAVVELKSGGPEVVFEDRGMTNEIVAAYDNISDEKVKGLVSGEIQPLQLRPQMMPQMSPVRRKITRPQE